MFAALGIGVRDLDAAGIVESSAEDDVEVFETFEANALAKARYFHGLSGGWPTVADDSGLEVDALDGAPGVRSRRFAGATGPRADVDAANNAKLVHLLQGATDRRARFVCAAAFVDGTREVVRTGYVHGRIVDRPAGSGGFGYDPHFLADELATTFGMASDAEKARVSHRAHAFAALVVAIRDPSPRAGPAVDESA